ncbi:MULTISPECIES: LicD family protein [unclassified Ruminococcus]|uniref:LicD family protein n=1 Tax=unclassified Ruminococcus TaxID=2608920 RepID=UPI00210DCED3|nr:MULTISPECIES: LicD family protein [unclassified Ruminococcus]MCQ4022908.1 NAD-dependent epimerase/dehydratase family protein [Ruminococcus sp. zg-924]MCQ4115276.1 NAD-dependent epimerase/dehydratase family protein [Ruminococcus sp. zg-921]
MEVKNLLNEYEFDWAAFPSMQEDFPYNQLKDKSIIIAGGQSNLARALLYALLAANDLKGTGISVSLLADDDYIDNIPDGLIGRRDFRFFVFGQQPEKLPKADIVISTGICNTAFSKSPEFFSDCISRSKYTLEVAEKTGAQHFILLSDYRAYGKAERGVLMSEYENGRVSFSLSSGLTSMLTQAIEAQCAAYAKQKDFDFTILRCAIILGACAQLDDSIISDMLKAVAIGDEYTIINSKNKYSFVYLSDVLNAVFHAASLMRRNTTYNVVGADSTVSTGMLSAILHDLYPERTKITLEQSDKDPAYGVSMNNQKIVNFGGCKPKITLAQAVELVVKSFSHQEKTFVFDDSYQGKIKSIQNILLLYLLEIDRICRKHNIKYFLAGGTLLGAIRHKGFIPWDDDADVMMLREDYNKFLEVVQSELPGNVKLHTVDTDPKTHNIFTKLRIDNTMFATKWTSKFPDMHNGIFFDVLAHDKTANSKLGRKIHLQLTLMTRSLVFNKWHGRKVNNGHKFQSAVTDMIKKILPLKASEKLQFKCLRWFEKKKDAKYLYDGMGRNVYKGDFPKKWLKDTVYWDFEGYRFPVPKDYDKYLRYLYGDYKNMVLASERQTSHDIVVMDLGEYLNAQRPKHIYHSISVSQPISDKHDLPKKYPKRSESSNAQSKKGSPDENTVNAEDSEDVKVFVPNSNKTKQSTVTEETTTQTEKKTSEKKISDNKAASSEQPTEVQAQSAYSNENPQTEPESLQQTEEAQAEPEVKHNPQFDETIEFSLRETDISKYSSSEAKRRLADTREFELPEKTNE